MTATPALRRMIVRPWLLWLATLVAAGLAGALAPRASPTLWLYALFALMLAGAFFYWRAGLVFVVVLVTVEGYLRNRSGSATVLLLKDVLIAVIYLRVLGDRLVKRLPLLPATPLNWPLAAFAAVALVQCFNPNLLSPTEALVGLRTWLFYIPLFHVGWLAAAGDVRLRRVIDAWLALSIPVGALAVLQWLAGPGAYAAQGASFEDAVFTVGVGGAEQVFRPNSTFAWSSQFALFLALQTLLCLGALLGAGGRRRKAILVALLAFLSVLDVLEAQRAFWFVIPLVVLVALVVSGQRIRVVLALVAAVALALAGLWMVARLQTGNLTLSGRLLALLDGSETGQLWDRLGGIVGFTQEAIALSPIGLGPGATTNGVRYAIGGIPVFLEFAPAKVIADLSLLGLVAYLWLFGALINFTIRGARAARAAGRGTQAGLAAAMVGVELLVLYWGYEAGVGAVSFWLLTGFCLAGLAPLGRATQTSPAPEPRSLLATSDVAAPG